jgi:hypothetical protein
MQATEEASTRASSSRVNNRNQPSGLAFGSLGCLRGQTSDRSDSRQQVHCTSYYFVWKRWRALSALPKRRTQCIAGHSSGQQR